MRHRRRTNIIIELTPLLDVIMILIFIIMTNSGNAVVEARAETKEAHEETASVTEEFERRLSEKDDETERLILMKDEEIQNIITSNEEVVRSYEDEVASLTEQAGIATGKLDQYKELYKVVVNDAAKLRSYDTLSQYVRIVNISLAITYKNYGGSDDFRRMLDNGETIVINNTLSYAVSGGETKDITTFDIPFYINGNEAQNEIMDSSRRTAKNSLKLFLNESVKDTFEKDTSVPEGTALYIVTEMPADNTNVVVVEDIEEAVKYIKELYKDKDYPIYTR